MSENAAGISAEIQPPAVATAPPSARRKKKSNMALAATDKSTEGLHYCAKAIVEVLRAAGPAVMAEGSPTIYGGIGRDAICAGLAALNLKTAQPPIRVLYYWKKHLINGGWAVKVQAAA